MGRLRFVEPEVKRYEISDGDWVELAMRLAAGEQKRVDTAGLKRLVRPEAGQDKQTGVDVEFADFSLSRTSAYLKGWSFKDKNGGAVEVTRDAIEALDAETYAEIEEVIRKHVEEQNKGKKTLAGEPQSKAS